MNIANRDKVITVIREVGHTADRLRSGDFYCAWGAACEAYRRDTGRGEWQDSFDGPVFVTDGRESSFFPPAEVERWLGLDFEYFNAAGHSFVSANGVGPDSAINFLLTL
jgi:hypothetical protein